MWDDWRTVAHNLDNEPGKLEGHGLEACNRYAGSLGAEYMGEGGSRKGGCW